MIHRERRLRWDRPRALPTALVRYAKALNGAFSVFVFFYYTQVLGLPTHLTGVAVLIALIVDAITDPLIGSWSDNWRGSMGRRHPFLYASALPLAAALIGLLNPPSLGEFGLFVWLTLFAVLTRAMITLAHVPHVSLGAELSDDFHDRTTIVAFRYFFGYFGHFVTYFLGFYVFLADSEQFPKGQFNVDAYLPFSLALGVIIVVTIIVSALGTHHRIPYLKSLLQPPVRGSVWVLMKRPFLELWEALHNYSFRWLFGGVLIVFMMVGVDQSLNLHMNTYFWELQSEGNFAFFVATPIGALIGTFFATKFNVLFDKKPSIVVGTAWWAICQILPVVLRLLGWFPENGTSELLWTLVAFKFAQGFGVVQALITFSSMIADIVDEHELNTGSRREGIFFSAVSFSNKVTTGIGSFVGGLALTAIAWPVGPEITSAAQIPPDTLMWLGLIFGPIVSGFAAVCVYCYSKHNIDKARHEEIVAALAEVRGRRQQQLEA